MRSLPWAFRMILPVYCEKKKPSWLNDISEIIGVIREMSDKPSLVVVEKLEADFSPTVANKEADFS